MVAAVAVSRDRLFQAYYEHQLRREDAGRRIAAVQGLGRLRGAEVAPPLVRVLASDPSADVRKAALRALEAARLGAHEIRVFEAVASLVRRTARDGLPAAQVSRFGGFMEQVEIVVTRPAPAFSVQLEFTKEMPGQTMIPFLDACHRLELDDLTIVFREPRPEVRSQGRY